MSTDESEEAVGFTMTETDDSLQNSISLPQMEDTEPDTEPSSLENPGMSCQKTQVCHVRKPRYVMSEKPGMLYRKTQVCLVRKPRYVVSENPGMSCQKTQVCQGKPRYVMSVQPGKSRYDSSGLYT